MDRGYLHSQRLIGLRKEMGKTIADMAYECGLSASTISGYERGVRIADGKALIKLANYFDCTSDYLLGLSDFKNNEHEEHNNRKIDNILTGLAKLSSKDKDNVIEILTSILSSFELLKGFKDLQNKYLMEILLINKDFWQAAATFYNAAAEYTEERRQYALSNFVHYFSIKKSESILHCIELWNTFESELRKKFPYLSEDIKNN